MVRTGNIFVGLAANSQHEQMLGLADGPGVKIVRIVSAGQATPPGEWYDLDTCEWVAVLQGSGVLKIEGEDGTRPLQAGDWIELPAHTRHRVEATSSEPPAIWLAVHFG